MSGTSAVAVAKANLGAASSCGRSRNFLRFMPRVVQIARGIFPSKTARYLSDLTKDPVRTWEYWLSNDRLSAEAMGALIASEHGMKVVDAIAGASPWWREVRRALAAADEQQRALLEAANVIRAATEASTSLRVPNIAGALDSAVDRQGVGRVAPRARTA